MIATRVIWHHSAYLSNEPQFGKINEWHKERGFPISSLGYFVGYHYVIEKNGAVLKAREENEIGAHDQGENVDSIGICLAGDFNTEKPTQAQADAFRILWLQILHRNNIPILAIEPHRRDDTTDCPGKLLTDDWVLTGK